MTTEPNQVAPSVQNLFWVLLVVFGMLALDAAVRFSGLLQIRNQLDEAQLVQAQNISKLAQGQEAQNRVQLLSYELLRMAETNDGAKKMVQDFNIRLSPDSSAPPPATVPISQPLGSSNPPPAPASLLSTSTNLLLPASNPTPAFSKPLTPAASNLPPAR